MEKRIIEVQIWDIEVDEEYYTIQYKVLMEGKVVDEGEVNDDYENGETPKQWKKTLEKGEAFNIVLSRVFS